mgnify:CR=1 FL=1
MKQHIIDPELCIRCHTCEEACPIGAITHDDNNVVVNPDTCNFCMDCISPCPTGSIDHWRIVDKPYSLEEQFTWLEMPEEAQTEEVLDETLDSVESLIDTAHSSMATKAPASATIPSTNLFSAKKPAKSVVQGNYSLTTDGSDVDIHHIILSLGDIHFPILEGQTVGIIPPGTDANGRLHTPRLYSVSSPRDGERPSTNNLSLTVKREESGVCSNYVCDLKKGDSVELLGPFGSTFLIPSDLTTKLLMICTGTGSAPFRAFAMHRQRACPDLENSMTLYFGARTPDSLPYFGPLKKMPSTFLQTHFAFSRIPNEPKAYVQDKMRENGASVLEALKDKNTHIYICGLKTMEDGVEQAFKDIARGGGLTWEELQKEMLQEGRYHIETY